MGWIGQMVEKAGCTRHYMAVTPSSFHHLGLGEFKWMRYL